MDRRDILQTLAKEGLPLEQMREQLGGVSRMRVHQLLKKYNVYDKWTRASNVFDGKRHAPVLLDICKLCGVETTPPDTYCSACLPRCTLCQHPLESGQRKYCAGCQEQGRRNAGRIRAHRRYVRLHPLQPTPKEV